MSSGPASQDPGRDEDPRPAPPWPDWMDDPAYLAMRAGDEEPSDLDLGDPEDDPPPEVDEGELTAGAAEMIGAQGRAAAVMARLGLTAALAADAAAALGRRGPGMPGSAQTFPGVYVSRASGFASGCRWIPRRGAWCWGSSRRRRPDPMTGIRVRLMMSWAG